MAGLDARWCRLLARSRPSQEVFRVRHVCPAEALFPRAGFLVNTLIVEIEIGFPQTRYRYGPSVQYVYMLSKGRPGCSTRFRDVPKKHRGKEGSFVRREPDGTRIRRSGHVTTEAFRMRGPVWRYNPGGRIDPGSSGPSRSDVRAASQRSHRVMVVRRRRGSRSYERFWHHCQDGSAQQPTGISASKFAKSITTWP